ncbi:hypothetical protein [Pedobacter nototheniae]|uniref:hypothetical protein n=1 Tax=Pedobacter nototheniae TaxID=2488994 RepID=UPI00292FB0CE|nr:hypothetical protein [Pedobacter nototheniae]
MKQIILVISLFLSITGHVHSQEINGNSIDLEFQKLTDLKWDYERYKNNAPKRDTILTLYKSQVNKIKKSPEIYLKYIRRALKNDKARQGKETVYYKYVPGTGEYINKSWHRIKKIDLYRVIRYSLFKKDDEILPEDFRGLPVIREKDYNGYDEANRGDFKLACRLLLHHLPLTPQEIRFVKNDNNQLHVLDMKKYLDKYSLSEENKDFIKWAIDYLIKYPKYSLVYLNNAYDPIRYQNYRPRDKPINNP